VRVAKRIVVLIGVLVAQEFMAAIDATMASDTFVSGIRLFIRSPRVVPTKKSGIIKPPRHPEVTVIPIAKIVLIKIRLIF